MRTREEIEEYADAFTAKEPTEEMDPKSIAYGMKLTRDAVKYLLIGAIKIDKEKGKEESVKSLQLLLEAMDRLPIHGESYE